MSFTNRETRFPKEENITNIAANNAPGAEEGPIISGTVKEHPKAV